MTRTATCIAFLPFYMPKQARIHAIQRKPPIAVAVRALLEVGADASRRNNGGETALDVAVRLRKHEVAACIRLASDEARRLCGVRQRLSLATAMLGFEELTGLGELPYDVLFLVGEVAAALGLPAVRVTLHAADHA